MESKGAMTMSELSVRYEDGVGGVKELVGQGSKTPQDGYVVLILSGGDEVFIPHQRVVSILNKKLQAKTSVTLSGYAYETASMSGI
ncbi:MAG: hypothetical protein AB8B81_13570 [Halioglobus sp.]